MKTTSEINTQTQTGRLLLMAIAKITTEIDTDKTPDQVLEQLNQMADNVFQTPIDCEHENCTRVATTKDSLYHPDKWFCSYHANKAKQSGRIIRKMKK